ncbi:MULTISPECIES: relaxase/mobilization nuclease domain-containing protein [unclassified Adlercreutzia]|uniref:relaxase/mobilization nuclease domain-containing protein n=1 Tax=unclassified Adlercreutzia TaxID=2636013 RepID=UPI0013EA811E|nr:MULTISPECIES: relaxase/mobilization nuclease domain-containing protein [unclassified Adlercreutzia]
MPILKVISGHGSTGGIRNYLEKGGRALGRDFLNLPFEEWTVEDRDGKALDVEWDAEMDATRRAYGTDEPWRGMRARTFKHFVISPDPDDAIDIQKLRELSQAWAKKHFGNHEIAIVYHDDNEGRIPHAHIVVNNVDLVTERRLHTDHPEDLNRDLQDMARKRGLTGLSNVMPKRGERDHDEAHPRSRQAVYFGRAERELLREGSYSWVGDIRARVALAKNTSRSEVDFMEALGHLGIEVSDNSRSARRDDWIFALADQPTRRVSGERLGYTFGKQMLKSRFERQASYQPEPRTGREIRHRAIEAIELNDLQDLSRLSAVLETCAKFDVRYLEDFNRRLATLSRRGHEGTEGFRRLQEARAYVTDNGLMARRDRCNPAEPVATRRRGNQGDTQRQRAQEAQRMRYRERGER